MVPPRPYAAPHPGQARQVGLDLALDGLGARAELGEDGRDHALALLEQRREQVLGLDRLVFVLVRQ